MSVFDVFLDAEFKYVSRISLSPSSFAPGQRARIFCAGTLMVFFYRGRHEEFENFFSQEYGVVFCNDVSSVMEVLGHEYNPGQWRCSLIRQK
jgi:hypothetical protein